MNHSALKTLCLSLMKADSEAEVIELLTQAGYWDNKPCWRFYGDYENNYNTIGNQQGRPDAALVEKVVNAVDARLMNECLVRGIDPESDAAPKTIRLAVARFFDESYKPDSPNAGQVKNWPDKQRTETARWLTLSATGASPQKGNPCFTIADQGEGQTPERMPDTFLSLTKSNKLRIPFVQGMFNMGGTGVFEFCGPNGLQLIITRRNQKILKGKFDHPTDDQWGFTVVRREYSSGGSIRHSFYTYLAPINAETNPNHGGVLRFKSDMMPIFPQGRDAYARDSEWGTMIKLYEYAATGFRSNIIRSDPSLLTKLDLLLPDVALPVRLFECRPSYKGHEGSFETNLTGLGVRLEDDRMNNLEEGFPSSCPLSAKGEQMTATIFAFKKGKASNYRKHEGIIFTLNGQTQGHLTPDFFGRKLVGLSYLADSILVMVDCSRFTVRAREVLFMNSRDRLRNGELKGEIEDALEEMLKQHQGLRALKERRRREQTESKLADSKPLEDILESLLKKSPVLANLFLKGLRASNPHKPTKVQEEETTFVGKRFPHMFKLKGKGYGEVLLRETPINMRARINFETDAENDYFGRATETGEFSLFLLNGDNRTEVSDYVGPNLQNGIGTLSVQLPTNCMVDDQIHYLAVVTDPSRTDPFENRFVIKVKPLSQPTGEPGARRSPPGGKTGDDREVQGGIAMPNMIEVPEDKWEEQTPPFDKHTAVRVKNAGESDESGDAKPVYDFYINVDNLYLKAEIKQAKGGDAKLMKARFIYGMVLLSLGLIQQDETDKTGKNKKPDLDEEQDDEDAEKNVEEKIADFTRAVAPVLLPMIDSLGDLEEDENVPIFAGAGEAT